MAEARVLYGGQGGLILMAEAHGGRGFPPRWDWVNYSVYKCILFTFYDSLQKNTSLILTKIPHYLIVFPMIVIFSTFQLVIH